MALPCIHDKRVTDQVEPTIELLRDLDDLHPDVLLQHNIEPVDYKKGLVFRSAVESIRGSFIASSTTGREGLVDDVLRNLYENGNIVGYQQNSGRSRYDFTVALERDPDFNLAVEVKGGEGNSINISDRPLWAREFYVWCHLDGAIVNQPAHGAHSIINRLTNELVRRRKLVDGLFFKDILCGTRTRPCPKYPGREDRIGLRTAPDIFLFPQQIPSVDNPKPPVHTLETLRFPVNVLDLFGVDKTEYEAHVWSVSVEIEKVKPESLRRRVEVWHQGLLVDESVSRSWRSEE